MTNRNIKKNNQERGRPISFSRDELIHKVTELFWTRGYNNLSLKSIAQESGLKRSSLYNSFQTKEALFLECFDYYASHSPTNRLYTYTESESVNILLHNMFEEICIQRSQDKANRGCLAANAYDELAATNSNLGEVLRKHHQKQCTKMTELIKLAIKRGEIPHDTPSSVLANVILSFMSGLNIHAKKGMTRKGLLDMSTLFLEKIGFTKPTSI